MSSAATYSKCNYSHGRFPLLPPPVFYALCASVQITNRYMMMLLWKDSKSVKRISHNDSSPKFVLPLSREPACAGCRKEWKVWCTASHGLKICKLADCRAITLDNPSEQTRHVLVSVLAEHEFTDGHRVGLSTLIYKCPASHLLTSGVLTHPA